MYVTKKLYLDYMKNPYNSRRKPDFENRRFERTKILFTKQDLQMANKHVKRRSKSFSYQGNTN